MKQRRIVISLFIILIIVFLINIKNKLLKNDEKPLINSIAKELIADTTINLNLNSDFIQNYKGKHLLIDFWSIYCSPCLRTMPLLDKFIAEKSSNNIKLIGVTNISVNNRDQEISKIKKFMKKLQIRYPIIISENANNMINYNVSALPVLVLVSPESKIIDYGIGEEETLRILSKVDEIVSD